MKLVTVKILKHHFNLLLKCFDVVDLIRMGYV